MQALQRLPRSSGGWNILCRTSGCPLHTSSGAVQANNPQDDNFLKSTVTATAGTIVKVSGSITPELCCMCWTTVVSSDTLTVLTLASI